MTPVTVFKGKYVAVFGLGRSGLVTCQALVAGGAKVIAADDSEASLRETAAAGVPTGDLRMIEWSSVAALVLAPGVPLTHPKPHWTVELAQRANVPIIGDIDLFCRERARSAPGAPFIAITGTNGKSTTTALAGCPSMIGAACSMRSSRRTSTMSAATAMRHASSVRWGPYFLVRRRSWYTARMRIQGRGAARSAAAKRPTHSPCA